MRQRIVGLVCALLFSGPSFSQTDAVTESHSILATDYRIGFEGRVNRDWAMNTVELG
ncbi:hypothetical protein KCN56_02230 [Photobacterium galatheae]|uniref:hypothetical protein n=1 Tax=Photobacterium galatheae TaxID=1654360 RepID=UPI00202CF11D|nr:hypothetical protein [Photobacterium galatheae]MCM0147385.1 hypothetical protein [Photobacterium galatheae]